MRLVLTGGRSFGIAVLGDILQSQRHGVVGVVTDDQKLVSAATEAGLEVVFQPNRDNGYRLSQLLGRHKPDLIVNAHGTAHLSERIRAATRYGAIGYHPSLLPRHRGRSAVEWTVHMRDPIAGGTVYLMDDGYDTGPIIRQDWCFVDPAWTASDLWREQLFPMGRRLLGEVLNRAEWGPEHWPHTANAVWDQREEFATYEPPYKKEPR